MPSKKHIQQGYAVVECTYPVNYTKTSEERYTDQIHLPKVHKIVQRRHGELSQKTFYARCKKNQTGDEYLSAWYSKIVRPEAGRLFWEEIEKAQEDSRERVKNWEVALNKGWTKSNSPRPPDHIYDEFDWSMLRVSKGPYCSENEPAEGYGKKLPWTE